MLTYLCWIRYYLSDSNFFFFFYDFLNSNCGVENVYRVNLTSWETFKALRSSNVPERFDRCRRQVKAASRWSLIEASNNSKGKFSDESCRKIIGNWGYYVQVWMCHGHVMFKVTSSEFDSWENPPKFYAY